MTPCAACASTTHSRVYFRMVKGKVFESCRNCEWKPLTPMYDDIFLGGGGLKTDENICDPKTGREIPFITKQDKAVAMKIAGVKQAPSAERQHGYRNEEFLHRRKYI